MVVMGFCPLALQGFEACGCVVDVGGKPRRPCAAGIRVSGGEIYRLVFEAILSRPEDYLSIYQSGCNHNCLKCHSWYFTQRAVGWWASPRDILKVVLEYRNQVTVWEPRSRATMWHASELCAHCGYCKLAGHRGPYCPGKLKSEQVLWSPQGWGPARNIVSFTGGDLYCQPAFYTKTFRLIKREAPDMWVHIETNGYGLTPRNLEALYSAGLDSIWLDLKAYNESTYRILCGTTNKWILEVPWRAREMGIVVEAVILYIPGMVEEDQIASMARILAEADPSIPTMLLAFFPEYKMTSYRPPTREEMLRAFKRLREEGLRNVKLGNVGVFCKTKECIDSLVREIGREAVSL